MLVLIWALFLAVSPNGLVVFRSRIFGGISAEVTTIFNESNLGQKLKRKQFSLTMATLFFSHFWYAGFGIVPEEGLAAGAKIGVADSAYVKSTINDDVPLYLPTRLPDDGTNPRVKFFYQSCLSKGFFL